MKNGTYKPELLITDLDGTLLDDKKEIPEKALEAIERWVQSGGLFTVATGRTEDTCRLATDKLPINAPVILYNGASIYDLETHCVLAEQVLKSEEFCPVVRAIMKAFPEVCVEIFAYGPLLLPNSDAVMDPYILRENQPYRFTELETLPERWLKIMLSAPHACLQKVECFLEEWKLPQCSRFYSADYYYELLPQGCTKGSAAKRLTKLLGIPAEKVAVLGDHLNDLEILQWAGYSYAPQNAHELTKKCAKVVPHSNNGSAIADVIEELMRM